MSTSSVIPATYGTLMRAIGGLERLGVADRVSIVGACRFEEILCVPGCVSGAVPRDGVVRAMLLRLRDPQAWTVLDRHEGYEPDNEDRSLFGRRRVSLVTPVDRTAWGYWYNDAPAGRPRVPSVD